MQDDNIFWFLEGELRDSSPWIIPLHDNFSIGRLESSDLILSSTSVSRKHAKLRFESGDLYVTDLNSSNGTYVNGVRLKGKALLRDGDLLKIGQSEFRVAEGLPEETEGADHTLVGLDDGPLDFSSSYNLSERESEILYLLVKGLNLQDIGKKLFISPGTVKNHVLKIYRKTDCHSRIELATKYAGYSDRT